MKEASDLILPLSLPCGCVVKGFYRFHDLIRGEGLLLDLSTPVHLSDALRHRDGDLLGGHPVVLPLGL